MPDIAVDRDTGLFEAGAFPRVSTGDAATDSILGGGFPVQSITILMGHPGTGKTVLAQQLAFHNAAGDRPVLYLTTMSEPLAKLVRYLQRFDFCDVEKIGSAVVFDDVGRDLAEHGPAALLDRIRDAIREVSPKLIIVDSFKVIHDLAQSPSEIRKFTFELASLLTAYDVTTFLVGEYDQDQIATLPEFAIADAIVQVMRQSERRRDERFLRVLKLRGSVYQEGLHAFRITTSGLSTFPRLVSPVRPADYVPRRERVPSGIEGLDELMGGGLWAGSSTLILGPAGAGKTTLALGFAGQGARTGEPSLYLNLQENPTQLARTIDGMGLDLAELRRKGLHLQYASPVELQIDSIVVDLFQTISTAGIRRVVIDAVGDLALAANDPERLHDYLYALVQYLMANDVTTLMTLEARFGSGLIGRESLRLSSIADTIIELSITWQPRPSRTLRIVKSRGTAHELVAHEFRIHPGGMRVLGPIEA